MKWQPLWLGWTGVVIALSSTVIFSQPSYADSITFRCQKDGGEPKTIIEVSSTNRKPETKDVFHWYRAFPSSPRRAEELCEQVSNKLQTHASNALHISFGEVQPNLYRVCLTKNRNERCSSNSTILFVLQPTEDPAFVTARLLDGEVLNQSSISIHGRVRLTIFGFRVPI